MTAGAGKRVLSISKLCIPLLAAMCCGGNAAATDRLVLRDFTVIRSDLVSFDVDGLVLATERRGGSKLVTWDEIESLHVGDEAKQAAAEKLLREVGQPLYRLRVRLETGDDAGLLEPAEILNPLFVDRRSHSSLIVLQSLVWGRIANGQREDAVEPWLLTFEILRTRTAKLSELPGSRKPQIDVASALLAELQPVWFDAAAARSALPGAEQALESMAKPVPSGARLYVASLALAAGEPKLVEPYLEGEMEGRLTIQLQQVLLAQRETLESKHVAAQERLQKIVAELEHDEPGETSRFTLLPLALYHLGRAQLASEDPRSQQTGLLALLRIPALQGRHSPDLAAAALDEVVRFYAKDTSLAARLRTEILHHFPSSWHAQRLRAPVADRPR